MKRYEIIAEYNICGTMMECLATTPTAMGTWCVCYGEEDARQRVEELRERGLKARYKEVPQGTAWYDEENWIG